MSMSIVVVVISDTIWCYQKFEAGLGAQVAEIVISYHILILFGLMVVGLGMGYLVDHMISQKKSIFRSPEKESWTETLMNLWGYELKNEDDPLQQNSSLPALDPTMTEPIILLDQPTRRGRKPTFPLERWIPIAMKWENRDTIRDAFTLGELIAEHLGRNSDGSPIVSEQTYYSIWRQRSIDEIRKRAKSKKTGVMHALEKERT